MNAAVIGAAGKMGRGITLLLLQYLVRENEKLILIDPEVEQLYHLRSFFKKELSRFAEKQINRLREEVCDRKDLVDNSQIIEEFVQSRLNTLRFQKKAEGLDAVELVFEAAPEDRDLKIALLQPLKETSALVLSNTSSIPIGYLARETELTNRLVGFHFYNPAHVQPLLELIFAEGTSESVKNSAIDLAKRLQKQVVVSNDVAGFIGNGHFIREVSYALQVVQALGGNEEAIAFVDHVTRDLLLRPMGIFQLVNFVGTDVVLNIAAIMEDFLDEKLEMSLLQRGQKLQFDICDQPLSITWKSLKRDPLAKEKIVEHLHWLATGKGTEVSFARDYLNESRSIADRLVESHVAHSIEDVQKVLQMGFQQVLL